MPNSQVCPTCGLGAPVEAGVEGLFTACAGCGSVLEPAGAAVVDFRCPSCGARYDLPARVAGKRVKCRSCGKKEADRAIAAELAASGSLEAGEWLNAVKHKDHLVRRMTQDEARILVNGFYKRGARRVSVLGITSEGPRQTAAKLVVELADRWDQDQDERADCLAWGAKIVGDDGVAEDENQKYLVIAPN